MLLVRAYGIAWMLVIASAAVLSIGGGLSNRATLILGFLASFLAGAALLVVFPVLMHEDIAARNARR